MAVSLVLPRRVVTQAKALLMAADGMANEQIARSCAVDSDTVRRWRTRFMQIGPAGVGAIAKGRGRKSTVSAEMVAEVLRITEHEQPPGGATYWSTRTMGARVGIGKDAVARMGADHDVKPRKGPPDRQQEQVRLQLALLRGDVREIRRLVDVGLAEPRTASTHRAQLLAGWSFASILDSEFAAADDDASVALHLGVDQPLFRALCALSSGMGGLERERARHRVRRTLGSRCPRPRRRRSGEKRLDRCPHSRSRDAR